MQYEDALERIYNLMQKDLKEDSKQSDELEVLSILVKEYEIVHYPVPRPSPLEAIRFRMEQMGCQKGNWLRYLVTEAVNRKYCLVSVN